MQNGFIAARRGRAAITSLSYTLTANDAAATWWMLKKLGCATWLRCASVRTRASAIAEGPRDAFL